MFYENWNSFLSELFHEYKLFHEVKKNSLVEI